MTDIKRLSQSEREEYWSSHVSSCHQSGLSQREFCIKHKISYWSFNSWKRRFDKKNEKNQIQEISSELVRELSTPKSNLEIILNDTLRVSIPDNFSEETLCRILQILGGKA